MGLDEGLDRDLCAMLGLVGGTAILKEDGELDTGLGLSSSHIQQDIHQSR